MLFNKLALALLGMIAAAAALPNPSRPEVDAAGKRDATDITIDPKAAGNTANINGRGCDSSAPE